MSADIVNEKNKLLRQWLEDGTELPPPTEEFARLFDRLSVEQVKEIVSRLMAA